MRCVHFDCNFDRQILLSNSMSVHRRLTIRSSIRMRLIILSDLSIDKIMKNLRVFRIQIDEHSVAKRKQRFRCIWWRRTRNMWTMHLVLVCAHEIQPVSQSVCLYFIFTLCGPTTKSRRDDKRMNEKKRVKIRDDTATTTTTMCLGDWLGYHE